MACLLTNSNQERIYLKNFHSFGRLSFTVSTLLSKSNISRIHAIAEWLDGSWYMRDLSSNGVWINKQRIPKDQPFKLNLNDIVCFAKDKEFVFTVVDLSAPTDLLLKKEALSSKIIEAIPLASYNILPDEKNPKAVVYFDANKKSWYLEKVGIDEDKSSVQKLDEKDCFQIEYSTWQLQLVDHLMHTELLPQSRYCLDDLSFEFKLSQDEESTQMLLNMPDKTIDFDIRSHHYLTLNLARQRFEDMVQGIDDSEQGWIYADMLAKDIGVDANYLNIQIFRARKQFVDLFSGHIGAEDFIQRRAGKIRFGGPNFRIKKGQAIECQSN